MSRRDQPRRPDLAARGRRDGPGARHPRGDSVPEGRLDGATRRAPAPVRGRPRLRRRPPRPEGERLVRGRASRRVPRAGARRHRRGDRLACGAALVDRRGRDDRDLVGRLQRPAGRGPAATRSQGDHDPLLDGRPLRGRRALHRRLRAGGRRASMGLPDARLECDAAGSRLRGRALAGPLARTARADAPVRRGVALAPAPRRLLEARVGLRGLRRRRVSCLRGRRLGGRVHERDLPAARGATRPAQGAHRARGLTRSRTTVCPGRRSDSSRSVCGGGTAG